MSKTPRQVDEVRDLEVTASDGDDVKGGRPMDDEVEFVGDSEQPMPRGPGQGGPLGGYVTLVEDLQANIAADAGTKIEIIKKLGGPA